MKKRNGYFGLQIEEDVVYILLVPPVEGGEPLNIAEIMRYLKTVHLDNYDRNTLNRSLAKLREPTKVKLMEGEFSPVNEQADIRITPDRMSAELRLYPPSNQGKLFTKSAIMNELAIANVKFGINEKLIDLLLTTPVFCHSIEIAKGQPPVEGTNASIEYHFETHPLAKPKMNEDGTVDFHELNIFTRVEQGQLLATLIPEVEGKEGFDVTGKRILPSRVKSLKLKYGKNIHLSEDNLQIFSDVSGDVRLDRDTVEVSNTYTVSADVDASTGDIDYNGNVIIKGSVRTGFRVRAMGDIQVNGVVEGADLCSDGNIVLNRGIQGMYRGKLEAKGDIVTKFIENATVKAGGNVRSGSILHSEIEAGDAILCEGRKSFVVGGSLSALNLIDSKTIGNRMGTITNIKLGADPAVLEKLREMEKEFGENAIALDKCVQVLVMFRKRLNEGKQIPPDKLPLIRATGADKLRLEARQEELKILIEESRKQIDAEAKGQLRVSDKIFPAVRIQIANSSYVVKDEQKYCRFHLVDGEIVADSYS